MSTAHNSVTLARLAESVNILELHELSCLPPITRGQRNSAWTVLPLKKYWIWIEPACTNVLGTICCSSCFWIEITFIHLYIHIFKAFQKYHWNCSHFLREDAPSLTDKWLFPPCKMSVNNAVVNRQKRCAFAVASLDTNCCTRPCVNCSISQNIMLSEDSCHVVDKAHLNSTVSVAGRNLAIPTLVGTECVCRTIKKQSVGRYICCTHLQG